MMDINAILRELTQHKSHSQPISYDMKTTGKPDFDADGRFVMPKRS
jgi:hypothetical protein